MPTDSTSHRLRITAATVHRCSLAWQGALAGGYSHTLGALTGQRDWVIQAYAGAEWDTHWGT